MSHKHKLVASEQWPPAAAAGAALDLVLNHVLRSSDTKTWGNNELTSTMTWRVTWGVRTYLVIL